ncbi:hypothetical protein [Cribrihabitans neustonicus]|uniref:hypothetical protein n=1 Tax=Cribrihabitans neustonicus TaxID=1429085 RepID=UPI003B5A1AC7
MEELSAHRLLFLSKSSSCGGRKGGLQSAEKFSALLIMSYLLVTGADRGRQSPFFLGDGLRLFRASESETPIK